MSLKSFAKAASLLGTALLAATSASSRTTTYTVFDEPYTMGQMSGSLTSLYPDWDNRPMLGFQQGVFTIERVDEAEGSGVLGFRALSNQSMVVEIENISPGERVGLQMRFVPIEGYRYVSFDYEVTYTGLAENMEATFGYPTGGSGNFSSVNMLGSGSATNLYLGDAGNPFFNVAIFQAVVTNGGSMTFQLSNFRGTAEPIAIPEPASAALLAGLGLFACAATRRRRR